MKKKFVIHPFCFAVLPVLVLYVHNKGQLRLGDLWLPLAVALCTSLVLWFVLSKLMHDRVRAGLITAFFAVWFFSYGHLQVLLTSSDSAQPGLSFSGASLFLAAYSVVLVAGLIFFLRLRRGTDSLTRMLNFIALGLVVWNLAIIGHYEFKRISKDRAVRAQQSAESLSVNTNRSDNLPNIYYIVLDGYARGDVLQELYDFDNAEFLDYLRDKGFFVADNARANYCQTMLSLASSLNLKHLNALTVTMGGDSDDRGPLWGLLAKNQLFDFLRRADYSIVGYPSIYRPTNLKTLDIRITEGRMTELTDFQECLLSTTPIVIFLRGPITSDIPLDKPFDMLRDYPAAHRRKVLFPLRTLPDTTKMEPPVFVFAHIVSPHPPFVFDRDGNPVPGRIIVDNPLSDGDHFTGTTEEYIAGYREQLTFINTKLRQVIDRLTAQSTRPTVIILQADHGPGSRLDWSSADKTYQKERLSILLAYYASDRPDFPQHDDLSPVNIFRLLLNEYFDANLPLMPNEAYYSPWKRPYDFTSVTDQVDAGRPH